MPSGVTRIHDPGMICAGLLLGRDKELSGVARALDAIADGRPGFLLISGEPGIGKSALLAEVAEQAAARGYRVLQGHATEFERSMPFGVLVDALEAHLETLDDGRLERMGVARSEELGAIFPALAAGGVATMPERYTLHRALRGLLGALGSARPLVLALDDLQWADEASLEALAALVRRPPAGRVLVVGAHRGDPALDELAHQLDRGGFARLRLAPLSAADAQRLVGPGRSDVLAQAGGNPFYLEQLARSPVASGLPGAIAVSIRQEIEALSESAQALLRGAAVAGEPADLRLAGVAAGLTEDEALRAVDEAQRAELLRPVDAGTAFSFRHPLVRRAVYEAAGPGWRIAAHGRLRQALIDLGADVTLIAHHVQRGAALGDEQGIAILIMAAERVVDRAPSDAAAWLEAALRLLPEEAGARRAELQARRGTALLAAGDLGAAHEALLAAGTDTAEKCWRLAEVERWLGHEQDAVRRLARGRSLAVGDPGVRVRIEIELMLIHEWNLRYDEALEAASAAVRAAAETGDPVVVAEVQGVMATTLVQADPRAALPVYLESSATVAGYDDHDFPAHPMSLWDLGWAATYLERYDEAIAHFDRGLRVARARGAHGNAAMFLADRAEPRFRSGRLAEARECAEEAVEAARAGSSRRYEWWALARLGLVVGRLGDAARAEEVMRECTEVARSLPASPLVELWTAHGQAAAAVAVGDFRGAAALLTRAGGPDLERFAPIDRTRPRLNVLEGEISAGRLERAERWAAEAEAWAEHCGLDAQRGWALIARSLVTAATPAAAPLAAAAGEGANNAAPPSADGDSSPSADGAPSPAATALAAAAFAGEAADAFAAAGARLEAERARTLQGRRLAEAGDRDGALAALELAERRLHELGADADRAAAARELRRLGRRTPRRDAPVAAEGAGDGRLALLSPREREVAELVARGATNQSIADSLYLSVKTVESHLRNIFAKAGVGSRDALAAAVNREARSADGA